MDADRHDPGGREVIQYRHRSGILDLGWGHPDPDLLPVEEWSRAWSRAVRHWGHQLLTYGHGPGPIPFRRWLGERLGETDAHPVDPDEIVVTAGASHALDLLATAHTRRGDLVLVQSPTYHLAMRILADHGLVPMAMTPGRGGLGIDVAATADRAHDACARGRRISMIYVVGTFANPTGRSLAADQGAALTNLAEELGAVIVEDDTYRELALVGDAPRSLQSAHPSSGVARIGSLSKVLAPALRIGWITGPAEIVGPVAGGGLLDSGGGVSHANALTAVEFASGGGFDSHVATLREAYRGRRDALVAGLHRHCPDLDFEIPDGGWFLWVETPKVGQGTDWSTRAERQGVAFLPGTTFAPGDDSVGTRATLEQRIRLSFSLLSTAELQEAALRLGRAFSVDGRD